ncbi:MAG: tripartite tricarboxylate transporter substrate binding protein [Betaproteobacteria bacterium]|jgi:tripartite-type tricarboxylate transporter receptor subunit TctC|nr:tripartite tricarboxylate transporter substrate binding protein [Betaproteobacteria bacterium]MDH5343678.1 tripartite tricarboxylate transporter substrate binding protein [Betaproteobacteria bacterium]
MKKHNLLILFIFLCLPWSAAQAQGFPNKTVRLIVPFAAGGSTDIIGRLLAQKLGEAWGQQVIVDNRPGGSTVIGTDIVAKSAPDGHTLLVTPAPFTIVPSLLKKLPYDPARDFEPITLINTTPLVVVVHPGVPAKNVKELIALARAKPGVMNFGSSGSGGSNHLAGELFNAMANTKIVHVPYKGNAPALSDLLGGHVDIVFNGLTSALQFIKSGKLRALGVTSLKRTPALPDLPTLDESGLKGFQAVAWNGLTGPARMPRAAVEKTAGDVARIMRAPDLAEYLKREGSDPVGSTTAEYAAFLNDEIAKWKKVIARAGITSL